VSEIVARSEMSRVSLSHFEARCVLGSASVDPESNSQSTWSDWVLIAASANHSLLTVDVLSWIVVMCDAYDGYRGKDDRQLFKRCGRKLEVR